MIKFSLHCENDHSFEAWFRDNEDFEKQQKRGLLTCPVCASSKIAKSLMAPSVATSKKKEAIALANGTAVQAEMLKAMREMSRKVKAEGEDVGEKFAQEARKIHYGEIEERGIYGKATNDEVEDLLDEGVEIMPLLDLPEDLN